jgi:hypothetical protein
MNYAELVALERMLRDRAALSVYLDGEVTGPATRIAWRRRLQHALQAIRHGLGAGDRTEFEAAEALLLERLAPFTGALGSAGYAAFVTAREVVFAQPLPVPTTAAVAWETGIRVVPLLRCLKLNRAAMLCLADARSTRLVRYRRGRVELLATHRGLERPDADRQVADLVDRMLDLSSRDDWLLFGGPRAHVTALAAAVPPRLMRRARVMTALSATAGDFELAQAAERAVASLRREYETAIVDALLLRSSAGGCSVTAPPRTRWAMVESSVEELVITRRFADRQPDLAEALVRDAFDHGAMVEEVGGSAAERLDAAGGVGALLRAGHRTPSGAVAAISGEA